MLRGDKIALVGPNGCGKSTLIKLLLGQLSPSRGTVKGGTNLEVAYFDQYREQLDPEKTVVDNVGEGKQEVMVRSSSATFSVTCRTSCLSQNGHAPR